MSSVSDVIGNPIETIVNHDFQVETGKVPCWHEPYFHVQSSNTPVRKTIKRNNKLYTSNLLPRIYLTNTRSLIPKINAFKNDVIEREIDLCLVSEIWEDNENVKHKTEIEKMLELEGLKYISTPV